VQSIIGYAPVPGCGWSIAVVVPEEIALKWASDTEKKIDSESSPRWQFSTGYIKESFKIFLMLLGGLLIIILIIGYLLAGTITTPIMSLMKGALRIGSGDLDHKISLRPAMRYRRWRRHSTACRPASKNTYTTSTMPSRKDNA
jgi:methyl-accepting chemotaxis protein